MKYVKILGTGERNCHFSRENTGEVKENLGTWEHGNVDGEHVENI